MHHMTTSKSIVTPLLPADLIQRTGTGNRSAMIEAAVRSMQVKGVVAVVGQALQARLTKSTTQEAGAKVTASLPADTVTYLREVSEKTGLSTNQLIALSLETSLLERR
jgi:hypothetical protein